MKQELNNNNFQMAIECLNKRDCMNSVIYAGKELRNIDKYIYDKPNPKYIDLLIVKIKCYQRVSLYNLAIRYCNILISLEPNNVFALNAKAEALIKSNDYSGQYDCDILNLCRKSLNIEPSNADTLNRMANFLNGKGYKKEACSYYDMVLTIDSNNIVALHGKAKLSSPNEALNYYDNLIQLQPDNKEFLIGKLDVLEKLHMFEDVIISCDKFIEIYKGEESIISAKVRGLIYQGKFYDAVDYFYKETNLNTRYMFLYNYIIFSIYNEKINFSEELAIKYDLEELNNANNYMKEMLEYIELADNRIKDAYYNMIGSASEHKKIEINFDVTILVSYIERVIKRISNDIYSTKIGNYEDDIKNLEKLYEALDSIFNIEYIDIIKLDNSKGYKLFGYKANVRELYQI